MALVSATVALGLPVPASARPHAENSAAVKRSHPTIPPNWKVIGYGDSRTENGIQGGQSHWYVPKLLISHWPGWVVNGTGGRLQMAQQGNYGISGGTLLQAAANNVPPYYPRLTSGNRVTSGRWYRDITTNGDGSDNRGLDYVNRDQAGVVLIYLGANDATSAPANLADGGASRRAMVNILTAISPTKLIILCNDNPRGVRPDGSRSNDLTSMNAATFKAYADWIKRFDWASGDPLSRPNVVVVDTWAAAYDPVSAGNFYNQAGLLADGLHSLPCWGRLMGDLINAALTRAFGSLYTDLPRASPFPTRNGLAKLADAYPYYNLNPIFTPGAAGTFTGAIGAGTCAAATIPQGWSLAAGNAATLSFNCDKISKTDVDGSPIFVLKISGNLAPKVGATLTLFKSMPIASIPSYNVLDQLRGLMRVKVLPGSIGLQGPDVRVWLDVPSPAGAGTIADGSAGAPGVFMRDAYSAKDAGDASRFDVFETPMVSAREPNMSAAPGWGAPTTLTIYGIATLYNNTTSVGPVNAEIWFSKLGVVRIGSW